MDEEWSGLTLEAMLSVYEMSSILQVVQPLRPYLESFVDSQWLAQQLAQYEKWLHENSAFAFATHYTDRPLGSNPLVALLWATRSWEEYAKARSPEPVSIPPAVVRLWSVAGSLRTVELLAGGLMDKEARHYLRSCLQSPSVEDVWGTIHQCEAFITFARKGLSPVPCFLRRGANPDIALTWKGTTIPVECKSRRSDGGRFLPADLVIRLAGALMHDAGTLGADRLVRVRVASKLRPDDIEPIRHAAREWLPQIPAHTVGEQIVQSGGGCFTVSASPLTEHLAPEPEDPSSPYVVFAEPTLSLPATASTPARIAAVVRVIARPEPERIRRNTLRNPLKRAAEQLDRGGHPGIVALHYFDASPLAPSPGELPGWMGQDFDTMLNGHPHVMGVLVSFEPSLAAPGQEGVMSAGWWPYPSRTPVDFPFTSVRPPTTNSVMKSGP